MKFLDLRLLAYGPFKDVRLDFQPDPLGLHVIYGRNEAGKSTALRAVKGLLYGIPRDTPDAHLHRTTDLRIGARLAGEDGATLEVVRRKGNQNTLLDTTEQPINEDTLRRFLRGVGEEHFTTMFGIDHETLRRGAQALLQGRGNVGESLFEAGLGGVGLHEVLSHLRSEAEAIYSPQARNKPLNDALKKFADAQKRSREQTLSSDTWQQQKKAIEASRVEQAWIERELKALRERQGRIKRARQALPLVARRKRIEAERAALGDVVMLAESAARDRVESQSNLEESEIRLERLEADVTALEHRRALLRIPESLLSEELPVRAVQERYGGYVDAMRDLPRVRADLRRVEDEANSLISQLGRPVPLDEAERLRVDVAIQARIRTLARDADRLIAALERATRDLDNASARLSQLEAQLDALPASQDTTTLAAVLTRARTHGGLEERWFAARAAREKGAEAAAMGLRALGFFDGPLEELSALPLPTVETVTRHEQAFAALEREEQKLADHDAALEARRRINGVELDALRRAGEVPTEEDLRAARERRGAKWRALRSALDAGKTPGAPELERYEAELEGTDALADRLRREAARVAQLARLLAEEAQDGRDLSRLARERTELEAHRSELVAAWHEAWRPAGITPLTPSEMRGFLSRHAMLAAQVEQLRGRQRDELEIDRLRAALKAELGAALAELGELTPTEETPAARLERGVQVLERRVKLSEKRQLLEEERTKIRLETELLEQERVGRAVAVECWRVSWQKSVARLGLAADATPEEAAALLETHGKLFRSLDERNELAWRVEGMERNLRQYADDVERLAQSHVPSLCALPIEQAAQQLLEAYQQGRADLERRREIDQSLIEKRESIVEYRERHARAHLALAELQAKAGAADLVALERAEERSTHARELDRVRRDLEAQLSSLGDRPTLESLELDFGGLDPEALDEQFEQVDEQVVQFESDRDALLHRIGAWEAALRDWGDGSAAAETAAEAQEHLARARGQLDRYLRVKLAGKILERQIEAYRERNQGPILTRASELFRRLTLGRYAALRPNFNARDQPVLTCIRADASEVMVEGLSDGTRDQLYLSLRLASLERHASVNEPMPLVVDDILIHFDDHRAQASLEVLGELSSRMQVLFFTHHARLVELARAAVPHGAFKEHQLP